MTNWKTILDEFSPSADLKDEAAAVRVCRLAIQAADLGTYGVGALLLDQDGEVVVEGHNEVFVEGLRSDLHAEMVVMNRFEATQPGKHDLRGHTLVSSLEPCPMCMTRLIFAGVGKIRYVKEDDLGGMVQRKSQLPPIFRDITEDQLQNWALAECSEALREAAFGIWDQTREPLDSKLTG